MIRHAGVEWLTGTERVADLDPLAEHGGEQRIRCGGRPLVPGGSLHVIASKPHKAVAASDELSELLGLLRCDFGDIRHDEDIDLAEILGRKRQPRNRPHDVVLVVCALAALLARGDDEAASVARRSIHTQHGYPVLPDRHGPTNVVCGERIAVDLRRDAGRAGIVKGDEQRDSFRCARRDERDDLRVDLNVVGSAPNLDVGRRAFAAVANRGLVAGDGSHTQRSRDEFKVGDRQIVGTTGHRDHENLGALAQRRQRLAKWRGELRPVAGLCIGDQVDLLPRSLHVSDDIGEQVRHGIEVKHALPCLEPLHHIAKPGLIECHVPQRHAMFVPEQDEGHRIARLEAIRDHVDHLERPPESR